MIKKLLLLFAVMLSVPTTMAVTSYQFELIIFANVNAQNFNAERWPLLDKNSLNLTNALDLTDNSSSAYLHLLPADKFVLRQEQARLTKASPYRILLHMAWRESLLQLNKRYTIHLYGGKLYDANGQVIRTVTDESEPYSVQQNWELDGKVMVQLDRYFNLNFNLLLAVPTGRGVFTYVPLAEQRRSKSRELNYVDNPLYGVLFKIVPIG